MTEELPDILGEDLGYLLGWVALGETLGDDDGEEAARAMGAAIVGCEEMQAIKAVLMDNTGRSGSSFHDPADLTDGHGNEWQRCGRPDCGLHVVRPGRVQCNTDGCPYAPQTAA